jgi:D-galactarolactone isomerase
MLDALAGLGDSARGIAAVAPDIPDSELIRPGQAGVRGIRVNLDTSQTRDPAFATAQLEAFAKRPLPLDGISVSTPRCPSLLSLRKQIAALPVPVAAGHSGSPVPSKSVRLGRA